MRDTPCIRQDALPLQGLKGSFYHPPIFPYQHGRARAAIGIKCGSKMKLYLDPSMKTSLLAEKQPFSSCKIAPIGVSMFHKLSLISVSGVDKIKTIESDAFPAGAFLIRFGK